MQMCSNTTPKVPCNLFRRIKQISRYEALPQMGVVPVLLALRSRTFQWGRARLCGRAGDV
jgi:hypothetical protein